MAVTQCDVCSKILQNSDDIPVQEEHILTLDVSASLINVPKAKPSKDRKRERDQFVRNLIKYISALRNSNGGLLLVHINDIDPSDKSLEHFHELVDVRLHSRIEDGSLFVVTYKKTWLDLFSNEPSEEYPGIVAVFVQPSSTIVTLDFKTKEPLDSCILDPSNSTVKRLLSGNIKFSRKDPHCRGISKETFQESRNIQVKALVENGVHSKALANTHRFIETIWEQFKLAHYVTAFSKIDGGGSFYLGVEEVQEDYDTYISTKLKVKGFTFPSSRHTEFIQNLKTKVQEELSFLLKEGGTVRFTRPTQDFIAVKFYSVDKDRDLYVLEVAVAAVEGLVFYDKEGPEAYEVDDNGVILRVNPHPWYCRLGLNIKVTISTDKAEEVHFGSPSQHRPKIRQIGSSIDEIEKHVLQGNLKVYPRVDKQTHLETLLYQRLEELSPRGLAYVGENLSVSANIKSQLKPDDILYDVCFIMDDKPASVLSVTKIDLDDKKIAERYNTSLARGVVQAVRKFMQEPFSVVFGLVSETDLTSQESFDKILGNIITKTSRVCVPESLTMTGDKYKMVIRAFLSSVALTDSVVNTDQSDTLWFLTLEQFCILSENMDQRQVIVRTAPSGGGKVLMREVAKRLERSGPTLLVMESEEQIQVARDMNTCSFMLTIHDWRGLTGEQRHLMGLRNIVTNCEDCPNAPGISGRSWTFITDNRSKSAFPVDEGHPVSENLQESAGTVSESSELLKRIDDLEKERQQHETEKNHLRDQIMRLQQNEEDLTRMLESVSLGGVSFDSGFGSDTRSLASWSSSSTSASTLSLDSKGATGGKIKSKGLLRNLMRKLPGSRKKCVPAFFTDEGSVYLWSDENKRNPFLLLCVQHEMDRERVNADNCHVTKNARLVNTKPTSRIQQGKRRFKTYWGTCGTFPIHLPPSPSALTPVPPAPQYWETVSAVGVKGRPYRWYWHVMEIGVVEEDMMDSDVMLYDSPRSWCLKVGGCYTHKGFCTQAWNQGEHVKCVTDSMSDTPGTSYTLRYGVVVDIVRGRVGFVDVDKGVVLEKMDVEFRQTIYPVFGVSPYPDDFTVEMRLIADSDVTMTEDKQKLIYSCLT